MAKFLWLSVGCAAVVCLLYVWEMYHNSGGSDGWPGVKKTFVYPSSEGDDSPEPRRNSGNERAEEIVKRNVLMIIYDDLRPDLGPYGHTEVSTPNFDRFAAEGYTFLNAYAQQGVCAPSRTSFMTGRRPWVTQAYNFIDHFRTVGPDWIPMPEHFKRNGYFTQGAGKTYHKNLPPGFDGERSWSQEMSYQNITSQSCDMKHKLVTSKDDPESLSVMHVCPEEKPDEEFLDHVSADHCIAAMELAVQTKKKFFVACGQKRPHIPYSVPRRFWDQYSGVKLQTAKHQQMSGKVSWFQYSHCAFRFDAKEVVGKKTDIPPRVKGKVQRALRRGYYSGVSFADYLLGRLLKALDRLKVADDTAVILFSDNGMKLGEHGAWSKMDLLDLSSRVPMMIRAPWIQSSVGVYDSTVVELLDVYRTAADLAGIPVTKSLEAEKGYESLGGRSMVPLLERDPEAGRDRLAFTQYPRCATREGFPRLWPDGPFELTMKKIRFGTVFVCMSIPSDEFTAMGYSVRSNHFRYVEWRKWKRQELRGDWLDSGLIDAELYDHHGNEGMWPASLDDFEYNNVIGDARRGPVVALLRSKLHQHFVDG